jgi:hypothetical protein
MRIYNKIYLAFLAIVLFTTVLIADETGYVNRISVTQGDSLNFYISTKMSPFNLTIYKYETIDRTIQTFTNIPGGEKAVRDSSYLYGCNWPLSLSVVVPNNWIPGVYYASFPTSVGTKSVVFFVKSNIPGSYSKTLYLTSANTWEAYNPYGGKSLYKYNSSKGIASYKVSFLRPGSAFNDFPEFFNELPIMRWLFNNNINVEYAVNYDLYSNPNLLNNYNILIIAGHSEYWAFPERIEVQNFERDGGNVIILSGNTLWWQVRYEDKGNALICYKSQTTDPYNNIRDSFVTVNWRLPPVNDPENKMTGLSFIAGGYVNRGSTLPWSNGWGGYSVINHHNWVFKGTNLMDGEEFGYPDSVVGDETDGALFEWQNGIPILTGTDSSPNNYRVLGISPAFSDWGFTLNPYAMMGIFHIPDGGSVFNAATIFWSRGFDNNYYVQKITRNVIDKFTQNRFPPDIVSWMPFNVETEFIHHENEPVNNRNFLVTGNQNFNFSIHAEDPYNKPINIRWIINGQLNPGTDSMNSINTNTFLTGNKVSYVTALAFNDVDTSVITWNFFTTQLAIYSSPVTSTIMHSRYFYKINVFNSYKDPLLYILNGPSWLTINNSGELSGIPLSIGQYFVKIIVTNQHNQNDTQSFSILVKPILSGGLVTNNIPQNYLLKQNYPNPFNPTTTISYYLPFESIVKLTIYNIIGEKVKELISGIGNEGNYSIVFNAMGLSSGVYFYTLEANSIDGKVNYKETKKLLLLK